MYEDRQYHMYAVYYMCTKTFMDFAYVLCTRYCIMPNNPFFFSDLERVISLDEQTYRWALKQTN